MRRVYHRIEQIAGNVISVFAEGISYKELAEVTSSRGTSLAQVIRIYQLQPMPMSLGGQAIGDDGLTVRGVIDSDAWIEAFTYYWKRFNTDFWAGKSRA